MTQLEMWGLNIHLLIGILVFCAVLLILTVAAWTGGKMFFFHRRQQRSLAEDRESKFDTDGRRLPPASEGICQHCGGVFEQVYHLPEGGRLCLNCLRAMRQN